MSDDLTTAVNLTRLGQWMDAQDLPRGPILNVDTLTGGTQNILLRFTRGQRRYVLRRPPLHKRINSDETMMREARVLAALSETDVPHPRLIATCDDLRVIGAAFYLMSDVAGMNPGVGLEGTYLTNPRWRRAIGLAVADGAASIGALDHVALGLDDFGRAEGYLQRQVSRWQAQLDSYTSVAGYTRSEIPGIEVVATWLEANIPKTWSAGLIHGDYHLANVIVCHDRPVLAAIIDWELATIGDPLLDLGWLLATWPSTTESRYPGVLTVWPWEGFPTAAELIDRYSQRSTRDLSSITWYLVLACYKLGIILEGTYARSLAGYAPVDLGELMHAKTLGLFDRASLAIARS